MSWGLPATDQGQSEITILQLHYARLGKVTGEAGDNSNGWSWEFHSDVLIWEFHFEALEYSNTMEWESHSNFMI